MVSKKRREKNKSRYNKSRYAKNSASLFIFIRYFLLFFLAIILSFSDIFYNLFLRLTIYPTHFLLNLIYSSRVVFDKIFIGSGVIELIPACIAVSAYLFLLILNLATPMSRKKRVYSLIFSFLALLIINILRIFILSILFIEKYRNFDMIHKFFWYFLSIVFVVCIWFLSAFLFKIKAIPVYDDFKTLFLSIKKSYK